MEKQEEIFSFQEKFDHSGIEREIDAAAFASSLCKLYISSDFATKYFNPTVSLIYVIL